MNVLPKESVISQMRLTILGRPASKLRYSERSVFLHLA